MFGISLGSTATVSVDSTGEIYRNEVRQPAVLQPQMRRGLPGTALATALATALTTALTTTSRTTTTALTLTLTSLLVSSEATPPRRSSPSPRKGGSLERQR